VGVEPFNSGREWVQQVHPHLDGSNVTFADGHAKWYRRSNAVNGGGGNTWANATIVNYGYWVPTIDFQP
jgi:prepilin-type processing-associated H-X9-DG protein